MAIHNAEVFEGQKPTMEELAEIERASKMAITFDDAPEMSEAQLSEVAAIAKARRAARKKANLTIRMPKETIDKAKNMLGDGYTGVLRRLITKAVNHPEMLRDCL